MSSISFTYSCPVCNQEVYVYDKYIDYIGLRICSKCGKVFVFKILSDKKGKTLIEIHKTIKETEIKVE